MSDTPFDASDPSHYFVPLRRPITRSPSPSRSPTRDRFSTHVLDPLLSDLSPSKTLEALSSSPTFTSNGGRSSALQASIAVASPAQRAFAVRAALAHKKLREWSVELTAWEWPSSAGLSDTSRGFQVPSWEERAAKRRKTDTVRRESWEVIAQGGERCPVPISGASFGATAVPGLELGATSNGDDVVVEQEPDDEYWGSLPARRVLEYEERIEVIKGEMEALDLEELKSQVLDAHIPSRSRPSSSYDEVDDEPLLDNYVPLGDFTALVTATTLQALPYLSRVMSLLNTWVIRVAVLKAVPRFLVKLEEVEDLVKVAFGIIADSGTVIHQGSQHGKISELHSGSGLLGLSDARDGRGKLLSIPPGNGFTSGTFSALRGVLEEKVASLGQLLDNMLDDLEGRNDTIPEEWIEKMEGIEESYGNWVVDAEKKVLEAEWKKNLNAKAQGVDITRNGEETNKTGASEDTIELGGCNGGSTEEGGAGSRGLAVAVRMPDLLPNEPSEAVPDRWSPDPIQQDGGSRHCEWVNKEELDGDIETAEVEGDRDNREIDDVYNLAPEETLEDIQATQISDPPPAQQTTGFRNCGAGRVGEASEGDMPIAVDAVGDVSTEIPLSQMTGRILTTHGLGPPLAERTDEAGAVGKVDEADVWDYRECVSGADVIEHFAAETEVAGSQPKENGVDDQEAHLGGRNSLLQVASRQASDTHLPVSSSPTPETSTADQELVEADSVCAMPSHVPAQANGVSLGVSDGEGYGLPSPQEGGPESLPLQHRIPSGSPAISPAVSPPTSQPEEDSRSKLGGVCLGDIRYNISKPGISIGVNSVDTSPTVLPRRPENGASSLEMVDQDYTPGGLGVGPVLEPFVQREGDSQVIGLEPQPAGPTVATTDVTCETELAGQESLWAFPLRSDSDSDDPQDTPDLSTQSSPSACVSQASVAVPQPLANRISDLPTAELLLHPAVPLEDQAITAEEITFERQPDLHLDAVALRIRDLPPEMISHASVDERTHKVDTADGFNPHGYGGLEAFPKGIASPFNRTNQPSDVNLDSLSREISDAEAEFRKGGPPAGVHITIDMKQAVLDFPDSSRPDVSVTDRLLDGVGSEPPTPVMSDTPESVDSPELAASRNLHVALEDYGQSNAAEPLPITGDAAVGGAPTGGSAPTTLDERGNSSPEEGISVIESLDKGCEPLVRNRPDGDLVLPVSGESPEALQHEETSDVVWARSPYSSPSIMGHSVEDIAPLTPITPSSGSSEAPQRFQPSAPIPSLSIDNIEEQSPSVRQYMKRHDTASSGEDPLGSLPALQIPKRRRKTNSSPEKSPAVLEKARKKTSDPAGTENEKIYGRGPIELSKAVTLEGAAESADDHLEKKISSILTTIPAKIRLSSEVEIESSPNGRSSPPKSYATVTPGVRPLRATSASPSFTLAPAYAKNPRPRAKGGNPDIKLYHLHRSSGEAPIKLFVRLVGENGERVMVRVGGGWADLGEYLKEYATHHGRRSASDGRIEIQDIPKLNSKSSIASLRAHATGRSTPTGRPDSAMSRPGSSLAFARTRTSEGSPVESRTPTTPKFASARRQELTPPSGGSSVSSLRSSSRLSWTGTEEEPALGLAGPKGRKVDISPDKQAWVEGMLGQVRKASAQKREEADFGSLGKIGTTKRVFRRGSKGSAGDLI